MVACRNKTDVCVLILYPTVLLTHFIWGQFYKIFWIFYVLMVSMNKDSFLSYFSIFFSTSDKTAVWMNVREPVDDTKEAPWITGREGLHWKG